MLSQNGRAATRRRVTAVLAAGAFGVAGCTSGGSGFSADAPVTLTTTVAASETSSTGATSAETTATATATPAVTPSAAVTASATETPAVTSSVTSSATVTEPPPPAPVETAVWADNSMVPHVFFHSLVVDPARAFADPESGAGYLDYMVTQSEFAGVLQQLYDNGYVLVSPHQLATVEADGRVTPNELALPVGKTPLVISIDDVSYYEYMDGDGFATNLFVAPDGRVLNNYTDAQGTTVQAPTT